MDSDKYLIRNYCCEICNQKFYHLALIYGCKYGHFFCQKCYTEKYYSDRSSRCLHKRCKSTISRMDEAEKYTNTNKMFGTPKNLIGNSLQPSTKNSLSTISQTSFKNPSLVSTSKKPIYCPYPGCQKTVAVSSFETHFKFEHKCVSYVNTNFDIKTGVQLNPYTLKCEEKLCIVLLNLFQNWRKSSSLHSGLQLGMEFLIKPLMIVLGTRLSGYELFDDDDDYFEYNDNSEEELNQHLDKIILWVACNVPTKCKYTIAVSTLSRSIRCKYCGPVSLISEDSFDLFKQGKGLILNQSHIIGMTDGGSRPVILDVVLHEEDEIKVDQ